MHIINPYRFGPPPYVASAVDFDSTDYLSRGEFIGNADGQQITISFWFKMNGGDGANQMFWSHAAAAYIYHDTANKIKVHFMNTSDSEIIDCISTATYLADSGWHHLLFSADTSVPVVRLWIDDTDQYNQTTLNTGTIDFTYTDHEIGAYNTGSLKLNGCLSEFWRKHVYYDFNNAANRRLFDDGGSPLKPIAPPSGAIVYLNGDSTNFHINQGSGGNYTVNGSLTACSNAP